MHHKITWGVILCACAVHLPLHGTLVCSSGRTYCSPSVPCICGRHMHHKITLPRELVGACVVRPLHVERSQDCRELDTSMDCIVAGLTANVWPRAHSILVHVWDIPSHSAGLRRASLSSMLSTPPYLMPVLSHHALCSTKHTLRSIRRT
ncbi:hypothetical protein C8Q77DRAFT_632440 [Trametes polyzona]|nr:hypothetical protein C8Q77DRAFT_632440 [Trametes polyzona]